MKNSRATACIQMIDVERINILNPRVRNKKIFTDITENISKVGLKRPVTVTPSRSNIMGKDYDLVCGQGRVEAFIACGQSHIPARIIDADEQEVLIMSLVENIARPMHRPLDLLKAIEILTKDYKPKEIAAKTGLTLEYVKAIINLLEQGEERLLTAVENGTIPVSVAVQIAESPGDEQNALSEAYEKNLLRGRKLLIVQQLLETRRRSGKSFRSGRQAQRKSREAKVSAQDLVRVYRKESERIQMMARKAEQVNQSLAFVVQGLRHLMKDEHFQTLLRAEKITTVPKQLLDLVEANA